MVQRHERSNVARQRIALLLPPERGRPGRPAHDNRRLVNAMLWILETGAPWRDLPTRYGPWTSVRPRFSRWSKQGLWAAILTPLNPEPDGETFRGDSTSGRVHQHAAGARGGSAGQAIGRSRGGPSRKNPPSMSSARPSPGSASRSAIVLRRDGLVVEGDMLFTTRSDAGPAGQQDLQTRSALPHSPC